LLTQPFWNTDDTDKTDFIYPGVKPSVLRENRVIPDSMAVNGNNNQNPCLSVQSVSSVFFFKNVSEIVPDMKEKAWLAQLVKTIFATKYKIVNGNHINTGTGCIKHLVYQ
jgi:hypothetical protein